MHVQSGTTPQWNSERGIWEWWYLGYTTLTEESLPLYATSEDGVNWEKANNIAFDSAEWNLSHVIRDEDEADPGRRYKALFSDAAHLNRHPGFSPDGFQWTFPDVLSIPSQDTSQLAHDKAANLYLATVKHRTEWGRSAWMVTSSDFLNWTDPKLVMHSDEIDQQNRRRRIQALVHGSALLDRALLHGPK